MRLALVQMSNAGSMESNLVKSINAIKEVSQQGTLTYLFSF
jgi:predicted amidohydrolase